MWLDSPIPSWLEPCCKPVTFFKKTVAFREGLSQHRKWSKTSRAVSQFSVSPHIWAEVAFSGVLFPLKPGSVACQEILRLEGYILTRDFACKILELLARRKSRAPAVVVGESDSAPNVKRNKLIWNLPEFFSGRTEELWKTRRKRCSCFSSDSPWCMLLKKCLQNFTTALECRWSAQGVFLGQWPYQFACQFCLFLVPWGLYEDFPPGLIEFYMGLGCWISWIRLTSLRNSQLFVTWCEHVGWRFFYSSP